jgi:hypothetical protein
VQNRPVESLQLEDRLSGRTATIRRPASALTSGTDLIALEATVRAWCNLVTQEDAEQELERAAAGRPERVVYGLLWLLGLWCSLVSARAGVGLEDECVGTLEYRGVGRELGGLDDAQWATLTQLVRRGVLAALHGDEEAAEYLRITAMILPGLALLRRHILTIADGLSQDMERNDLAPWGATAHVLRSAGWTEAAPGPA